MSSAGEGLAGRLARAFIHSKLTPLLVVAAVVLGAFSVWLLPREEEPQIIVPISDVFVQLPGASAKEVEQRVTRPLERLLWEVPGVEYIYSTSSPGLSTVIVRFEVGQDEERSLVRLNEKLGAQRDAMPAGASVPLVKRRSIDDVPVLALTLYAERYTGYELRRVALELEQEIKQVAGVSEVTITGGESRQVRVLLDPERLAARALSAVDIGQALEAANRQLTVGTLVRGNQELLLETGALLSNAREVEEVIVGASEGRPVLLRDVARVVDGPAEPSTYVRFGAGASARGPERELGARSVPAVTLSVAKHKGKNAVQVVDDVRRQLDALRGDLIPSDVKLSVTRDYGATARDKSNELLWHMGLAVVSVAALIGLALGRREALIVILAIPATLALTLAVFYLYGYTLNRITLFALIFSIGILVDDAIVVVENIARHRQLPQAGKADLTTIAVRAVDEVGNPTILATMTVIAAILPMAFVGGLMGPYMRPIPVGASAAMLFSLLVAFIVTPWATIRLLGKSAVHTTANEGRLTALYRRVVTGFIRSTRRRNAFLASVVLLLGGAMACVAIGWVQVKMLPFDDKSELELVINMPEGTPLEQTDRVARALADVIRQEPEVDRYQTYVGTSGPYNFNGLVRHYFLRQGGNVGHVQINLVGKGERKAQSHDIAKRMRAAIEPVAARFGARIAVAEVPPGPPVLQTLVAEIYGPEPGRRIEIARQVRELMEKTPGVVDVDWQVEDDQPKYRLVVDEEKAALSGVSEAQIVEALQVSASGAGAGVLHDDREKRDVPIRVGLDRAARSELDRQLGLHVRGRGGQLVSVGQLVRREQVTQGPNIYHKNLMPVVYVTADVAGAIESPVYAIMNLGEQLDRLRLPEGYTLAQHTARQPESSTRYAMKWDGEWHITYEVFRDLGFAFAIVLLLIYVLNVAWFQSFTTPLIIMSAIPFSLVGILPAHGLLGAFFTATSMIGFIAGAGVVVRNSIILVDFIEQRLSEGATLEDAVVDAGAVRFRPMLLTAAAVAVGAFVILFDPIFQGLAISLMAGEAASLLLSRMTVPLVYYAARRREAFTASQAPGLPPSVPESGARRSAA